VNIARRTLELKLKCNRSMDWPTARWFTQVVEDRRQLTRNGKGKTVEDRRRFVQCPVYQVHVMLERQMGK